MKSILIVAMLLAQGAARPPSAAGPGRSGAPIKVTGRILHQGNPVLLGAGIDIVLASADVSMKAVIAPDGSFEFRDVGSGTYVLSIPDGGAILLGDTVTVADRDVTGVQLIVALTRGSIHVSEPAVTRLELRRDPMGGVPHVTNTQGDGWFDIFGVPGTYTATPVSPGAVPLPPFRLTLQAQRALEMEAVLPRIRAVTVRASVEGGGAVPPFSLSLDGTIAAGRPERQSKQGVVQAVTPTMSLAGAVVDIVPATDGSARILVPEGQYQFGVVPSIGAARLRLKSVENAGRDLVRNPMDLAGDGAEIRVVFSR